MELVATAVYSERLNNERTIWLQPPAKNRPAASCLILLDAEYYLDRMQAPELLTRLQRAGELPPLAIIYVSHLDGGTRWRESFCNSMFAKFLADELVARVQRNWECVSEETSYYVGGLSLTGLAAAHAALLHPDVFTGAICQSASFWWSDERLVEDVRAGVYPLPTTGEAAYPAFRLSCGSLETAGYVDHGEDLIQRTSQLASNQAMRDALRERGHFVSYEEFAGGHDIECWKRDLPRAIQSLQLESNACFVPSSLDSSLLAAFESCTLPAEEWDHRAHVRIAYLYASLHPFAAALERMRSSLQTYNNAHDVPDAIDRGYHETITRAFMTLIAAASALTPASVDSLEFCHQHPELLDKRALLRHYSRERIMSWEAKREFVPPDLAALPSVE